MSSTLDDAILLLWACHQGTLQSGACKAHPPFHHAVQRHSILQQHYCYV